MADHSQYEIRWVVEGTRYSFTRERLARAFAEPGQRVFSQRRRRCADSDDTQEFVIKPVEITAAPSK